MEGNTKERKIKEPEMLNRAHFCPQGAYGLVGMADI